MNTLQDRIRGSLIGGAIGDALGYPVEFVYSFEGIQAHYGERGITRLDTVQHWLEESEQVGKAVVSDDTQMTLFTANGLLNAKRKGISLKYGICRAYIEWYLTQIGKKSSKYKDCWISDVPELNHRRVPGNTCMSSQDDIYRGKDPMNNSKGCGGQGDWYDATRDVESDVSIIQVLFLLLPLISLFYPWIRLFMSMIRNHISTAYFGLFCAMSIVSKSHPLY